MSKKLTILTIIVISFIGYNFMDGNKAETLSIGSIAPLQDLAMKSVAGEKLSLTNVKEKKGLIVVFSCNTCPFVIGGESFKGWEKDYNMLSDLANENELGFVLVNSNEAKRRKGDSFQDMKARSKSKAYKMNYLLDEKHRLADAFGAKTTPHVFMFDKDMTLIYEGSIDNTWKPKFDKKESYLINAIKSHATAQKIEINKTAPKGCSIKRKS